VTRKKSDEIAPGIMKAELYQVKLRSRKANNFQDPAQKTQRGEDGIVSAYGLQRG